jgi:thiosulfate/3-mercaptopyruvate sulfurtransferase
MEKVLISVGEAAALMGHAATLFIDARAGADAFNRYSKGHVPGALFVDLETELSNKKSDPAIGGRHPLPEPRAFGELLTALGITPSTVVIVYDDKSGALAAARFWWMMKAAGHEQVHVIDAAWDEMIQAGLLSDTEIAHRKRAPSPYPITNWKQPVASMAEVEAAADDSEGVVVDVREAYRFRGEGEPFDLVAGHIPGAVNIPYLENLDKDGKFRAPEELRSLYESKIPSAGTTVIVHCGSGVTACHTLLALEHAGISGAKLYTGSWSEWSRNDKPIATGA